MRTAWGKGLWLALGLACAAEEPAAPPDPGSAVRRTGPLEVRRVDALVSIDARDVPMPAILRRLSEISGVSVVADSDIEDRVTVTLLEVHWRQALDIVCQRTRTVAREIAPDLIRVSRPPRVTAEFKNSPLVEILDILAGKAGASLVIAPEIDPKVRITMRFQNIPWEDALDALVRTAGYEAVTEATGIVRIVPPDRLVSQMETRAFMFRYMRPQDLYRPKIKADTLVGDPKGVDEPIRTFTVIEALKSALTRRNGVPVGSLQYVADTNAVVVTDTRPVLEQIARMIHRLDVEPSQVHLEVKVVTTRNADLAQVGILYTTGDTRGISIGSSVLFVPNGPHSHPDFFGGGAPGTTPFVGPSSTIKRSRLPFGLGDNLVGTDTFWATDFGITATLRLFQQDADTRIEQAPSLSVLSDTEATIFVGESVRWAEIDVASTQSGTTTEAVKEAEDSPIQVGFQLLVVPHVVAGTNRIVMTVIPQTNSLTGQSTILPGFDEFQLRGDADVEGEGTHRVFLPRVATATVVTRMLVESGQTAVVGGLVEDRDARTVDKIPFLGDIPIVGHLFRYTDTARIRNHIIVFITPRIVGRAADAEAAIAARMEEIRAREKEEQERLRRGMTKEEWEEEKRRMKEEEKKEHERLKEGK